MSINWKSAAKWVYSQWVLYEKMYNEVADRYMIAESWSSGPVCFSVTRLSMRATDPPMAVGESDELD